MFRKITSHWQPLFSKKMAAAASFSYKIGDGGKDLATLLEAVLTWSGYWIMHTMKLSVHLVLEYDGEVV